MATYKVAPPVPRDGLILYLDCFNQRSYNGTGSTWYDLSGNENHFTIQGDIEFVDKKGFTNFEGNSGSLGNKIFCINEDFAKDLKLGNGGSGSTVLVWGDSAVDGEKAKIIGFNDADNYIDLYQNSASNAFHAEDGSTVYIDGNDTVNNGFVLLNTGYHQMGATNLNNGGGFASGVLTIGNEPSGSAAGDNAYPWSGSIAVVMMYDHPLPVEQIRKLHNIITQRFTATAASVAPNPELMVHLDAANTSSYPGFGNVWFDLSGNGNNAYKLGINGTPTLTNLSSDTASFYFPAVISGESGSFRIENSQTIQNLNQVTVEAVIKPESKVLAGGDTSTQTIFSKDNGVLRSFTNRLTNLTTFQYGRDLRPGLGFDQNVGVFKGEVPTVLELDSAGITTMIGYGKISASFGLDWDSLGILNTYSSIPIPTYLSYFSTKFEGYFKPKETGTYTFTIASDDGSDLFVSGTNVTNHYGRHGMVALGTRTGTIDLTSGSYYDFRARQYEWGGGEGLRVYWKKPSQISGSDWFLDSEEISSTTSSVDENLTYTFYRSHGGNGNQTLNSANINTAEQMDQLQEIETVISTPDLRGEKWYYVAMTVDASELTVYANTSSISASFSMAGNTAPAFVGSELYADNFKGNIAVLKYWNRALTDSEISASFATYNERFNIQD